MVAPLTALAGRAHAAGVPVAPVKDACLSIPRPLSPRYGGFRAGAAASFRLGFLHGLHCVGCCWVLMTLLFVVGVMNLLWIAALMVYVLLERLIRGGRVLSWWTGAAAVAAGVWMYWT